VSASLAGRVPGSARGLHVGRAHAPARPAGGTAPAALDRAAAAEGALQALARQWSSLAALGLGLVACGVGAGHLEHHLPVGIALAAFGLVAIGWGVLALRGPAPAPRAAAGVALVSGPAVLLSAPLTGTATTAAEAAGLVLGLAAGVLLALGLRASRAPGRRAPGGAGQAGTLAAGALLVALVTVPGLAATEAGAHAVPHGSHGLPAETGHAGH
jgi:drug/metabolite transporter (DMT)-like permease